MPHEQPDSHALDEAFHRAERLLDAGRPDEALEAFSTMLAAAPHHGMAAIGRALSLQDLGHFDEASELLRGIQRCAPDAPAAQYCCALDWLRRGDFIPGFAAYEARGVYMGDAPLNQEPVPTRPGRRWRGETPLAGRSILIHWEQGLGDTIQFARFVPIIERAGAQVFFEVQAPLARLLNSLDGQAQILSAGARLPEVDFQCPLMSLPHVLGTTLQTIPASIPYLAADQALVAQWRQRLGAASGSLRVGVVWHGNANNKRDIRRSIPLQQFIKALPLGLDYVALPYELREGDPLWLMARPDLHYLGHEVQDFADTAAIVTQLDLVITVDTSVAHLAGALGKPVWILIDHVPDWRWMLARTDSPWYPTARLFRQSVRGEWTEPLASVRQALELLAFRPGPSSAAFETPHAA